MNNKFASHIVMCAILFTINQTSIANPRDDWPQYRGPHGNGTSAETDLLNSWPENGPLELWRVSVGQGYSGISVSGSNVITMDADSKSEYVLCLDAATGKTLWRSRIDNLYKNSHGSGPRSTPSIDGSTVYALSASGNFTAKRIDNGATLWNIDIPKNFGKVEGHFFGYSMSPLVEGDLVLLAAGVDTMKSILAFDKRDGKLKWTAHTDRLTYSSPIAFDFGGQRHIVFVTGDNVISVSPQGKILWRYPWDSGQFKAKAAMPLFIKPDMVFASMSYDEGAIALRLKEHENAIEVEEVWQERRMRNHFNSSIFVGHHIYGFDNANLKCIDARTGKQSWVKHRLGGKGSLIYVDNTLIVLNEYGKLYLVEANPERYIEKSFAKILEGRTWTVPTLANGKLFVRSESEMVCLNLKKMPN